MGESKERRLWQQSFHLRIYQKKIYELECLEYLRNWSIYICAWNMTSKSRVSALRKSHWPKITSSSTPMLMTQCHALDPLFWRVTTTIKTQISWTYACAVEPKKVSNNQYVVARPYETRYTSPTMSCGNQLGSRCSLYMDVSRLPTLSGKLPNQVDWSVDYSVKIGWRWVCGIEKQYSESRVDLVF